MVGGRVKRARLAAAALVLALGGCVGPAVVPSAEDAGGRRDAAPAVGPSPDASPLPEVAVVEPLLGEWRDGHGVVGVHVSRQQEQLDWIGLATDGTRFVYIKATQGTGSVSPTHTEQREGAATVGLALGGYHDARPDQSSGTLQARFFSANGGLWSPDGHTLPGALTLQFSAVGDPCYGLAPADMVRWVREFSSEYQRTSGRLPVIATTAEVWNTCTSHDTGFGDQPLWLYDHADVPGELPAGWERPTLWQRAPADGLDRSVFFGSTELLSAWASAPLR